MFTSHAYMKMCRHEDNIVDQALKLANSNIKAAEQLEGDLQVY